MITKLRGIQLRDGTVDTTQLADSAVETAKINNLAVTTAKINDGAVTNGKLGADAVTGAKIADDAVDSEHIANGAIDLAQLSSDSVDGTKIANDSIDSEHLAAGAIDTEHIAAGQITLAKMASNSVDSDQYVDGSIDTAHIADAQITLGKMAADSVDGSKIVDDAINSEHLAAGAIDTEHIADGQVTAGKLNSTLDLSSGYTVSVATPTADAHAANKGYVDSVAEGLDVKDSVLGATVASFTMASTASSTTLVLADGEGGHGGGGGFDASANTFTHDNVSYAENDRILIKNGVNSNSSGVHNKWNGIYTVGSLTGATLTLTRSDDFNQPDPGQPGLNLTSGAFTFVERGDANADAGFVMTQDAAITLGTTQITWAQFSGAGSFSADNGVSKTGSNFSLNIGHLTNINYANGTMSVATQTIGLTTYQYVGTFYSAIDGDGTTGTISINSGFLQIYLNGILQQVSVESDTSNIGSALPNQDDAYYSTGNGRLYFPNNTLTADEDIITVFFGA